VPLRDVIFHRTEWIKGDHARKVYSAFELKEIGWVIGIQSEVSCKLGDGQGFSGDAETAGIAIYEEAPLSISRASGIG